MNSIVENYKKKCLPGAYRFRTPQELNELLNSKSLTSKDLDYLYYLRGEYFGFRIDRDMINSRGSTHNNEPGAVIFLDIKGTLYEGGTHESGVELLARSRLDSKPITYDEIDALGNIIARTMPQDFRQSYQLSNGYKVVPTKYAYEKALIERQLDFTDKRGFNHRPKYMTKYGPFTVVFISSDTVETQKNIVAFLYYMAQFIDKTRGFGMLSRFGAELTKEDLSIEGNIKRIEERLLHYGNDFMKFLEYEDRNYANLYPSEMEDLKKTIDSLYFLSTSETGKTKGQLMEEFLESNERKKRTGGKYHIFALGDDYDTDGEMLRKAFLYGGTGLIRAGDNCYSYTGSIKLIKDLANDGINIPYIPVVNSIAEFYSMIMKTLIMTRDSELITAMIYANHDVGGSTVFESSSVPLCLEKVRK